MTDYVIDIETNGIEATKIHCISVMNVTDKRIHTYSHSYDSMRSIFKQITEKDRIIGHNFIRYDAPVIERILDVKIKAPIIDTLALSWYLYTDQVRHGLEFWGTKFGVEKEKIDSWENQSISSYIIRCEKDVQINYKLWERQKKYIDLIYDKKEEQIQRLFRYLALKMKCARLAEKSKWKLDTEKATRLLQEMETKYERSRKLLEAKMPNVEKKVKKKKPKVIYKTKSGVVDLTVAARRWADLCYEQNKDFLTTNELQVVKGYEKPNANSVPQIKNYLYSIGWKPKTYKYKKSSNPICSRVDRIPQIKKNNGDACDSITKLFDKHPEVKELETMTVVKHRIGLVKGLLQSVDENGFVAAKVQGLTNTMRFKHAVCVNIPSPRKPYGAEIRSLLTCRSSGTLLIGSDLCSLEDRTKQHYMWKYDPEYVKEMMKDDFDPHLDLALSAGAVTQEQVNAYKDGSDTSISNIRHVYKGGNYACTYGAGVSTLANQLEVSEKQAKEIHNAYWKRNWALKEITKNLHVTVANDTFTIHDKQWVYNPVSQLFYRLKNEKDKFSTLNQGTGTFCFDMWLAYIIKVRPQITGQFHDEVILEARKESKEKIYQLLKGGIDKVNKNLKLNRTLDCDIEFGENYSQIH